MDIDTFSLRLVALERRLAAIDGGIVPQPRNPDAPTPATPGTTPQDDDRRFPSANDVRDFIKGESDRAVAAIKEAAAAAAQDIKDSVDAGVARIGEAIDKELADLTEKKPGEQKQTG